MASDHADEIILADPDPLGNISAMAIDPADSKVFTWPLDRRQVLPCSSQKTGETWSKLTDLPDSPRRVWVDPHSPDELAHYFCWQRPRPCRH